MGVASIFVDDTLGTPAGKLSDDANDASGAVLAVVAVDQEGVVLAVEDDAENGLHGLWWDGLLFGSLHVDDDLSDSIGCDKSLQIMVEFILLDQSDQGLELEALDVLVIVRLGITASVDARNDDAKVVGSITF